MDPDWHVKVKKILACVCSLWYLTLSAITSPLARMFAGTQIMSYCDLGLTDVNRASAISQERSITRHPYQLHRSVLSQLLMASSTVISRHRWPCSSRRHSYCDVKTGNITSSSSRRIHSKKAALSLHLGWWEQHFELAQNNAWTQG